MYNRFNFFKNTFAVFTKALQPNNFTKPHYKSKHGSCYFFTNEGVFRYSNHWGRVGNCRWRLDELDYKQQTNYWGFCSWNDFFTNNEDEKLYFIEKVSNNKYTFNHKSNATNNNLIFRSANETAKIIKKINELNENSIWSKHLQFANFNDLKDYFITQLITTNKSFIKIKQDYINDSQKNSL